MPFRNKFIYIITDRGFGSELLTLAMGILLSEERKMKFILCSEHSNITYKHGWEDYFEPFCEEINGEFLKKNFHFWENDKDSEKRKFNYKWRAIRKLGIRTIYLHELWGNIWNRAFEKKVYHSKKYAINGLNGIYSTSIILKAIWKPKEEIRQWMEEKKSEIKIESPYLSLHLRRGDKTKGETRESDPVEIDTYVNLINTLPFYKDIYVISDDYEIKAELKHKLSDRNIISLVTQDEKGYDNPNFSKLDTQIRFQKIRKLIFEMELCRNSEIFIGPYSSNLSRVIALLREDKNSVNIEGEPIRLVY